jgi:hypothetical protein
MLRRSSAAVATNRVIKGVPDSVRGLRIGRRRGPGQVRGQSVRGPPTNPYRDDGGQALIRINAAPMFGQWLTVFRHGL